MTGIDDLARVRTVADAVLYEGYLLYPYRSTSSKNRSRWQFGVLGPDGAADRGVGEETAMHVECLLDGDDGVVEPVLRFLQLQVRTAEARDADGFHAVPELVVADRSWLSWDEAVEVEVPLGAFAIADLAAGMSRTVPVPGGADVEELGPTGRLVRTRFPLRARVDLRATRVGDAIRIAIEVRNTTRLDEVGEPEVPARESAIRHSLVGAHLLLVARGTRFVSLLETPERFTAATAGCRQHRCYPVLAGDRGTSGTSDVVLASPIILYDHPEVAAESSGDLFDATEIDEILTLRVMTLTDDEKAQARATDPLAAELIDRCDSMGPSDMQRLHGALRDPRAYGPGADEPPTFVTPGGLVPEVPGDVPWWDPAADTSVRPHVDGVLVDGVRVAKGTLVRLRPSRRADAQDLFFAGQIARVATVHADVDGGTHVGVVLVDDPAAELHDWYGRYLYFAPDEVEPLGPVDEREENRS
ncbi:hypothetical protein [Rhodococcus sp. SGAir0479]|uniref:hypothetical protein n=1 Tax=Rhodococcus sp. SGAir0479 TaxID=2567884 RepID=UPI0010CD1E47|nr:hypothetical protein [Rhodococcus sp. SGAir0479]QCQ92656.1 hypothetical protein E7742_16470 [Rhodococcus sp. SGAir0479]